MHRRILRELARQPVAIIGLCLVVGGTAIADAGSTSGVSVIANNGVRSGLTITRSNASSGGRGVDVSDAGVGVGVFASVTTGADGRATVRLPAYAGSIAADWRYSLTPIGRFGQVIVAREVRDGAFVMRSAHPATKVSWSVVGTRTDAYARAHPFAPVKDKAGPLEDLYLRPAAFGEP